MVSLIPSSIDRTVRDQVLRHWRYGPETRRLVTDAAESNGPPGNGIDGDRSG